MESARLGLTASAGVIMVNGLIIAWKRVTEEEMMLKKTFGKEWEDWHKKTKRFIPGVF